ncbi:phosphodiester glycosidase family protein [Neobacillus endophyticus]|uniref:phosphodiester glycosidase family protein n=1 Tax=Neobacillus endophyticus TaxID=2738405 RepID=UPI001C2603C3|nr:phosphodiester glycosidase family protein [Neobacillus endophyticus]
MISIVSTSMHPQYIEPLSLWTVSLDATKPQMNNVAGKASPINVSYKNVNDSSIEVKEYHSSTFSAQIMLVHDPKRIKVAVTKYKGDVGETVSEMVADANAVAGINGGSFSDVSYRGTGGIPLGNTIQDGKFLTDGGTAPTIGFTDEGVLVVGTYSKQDLINDNVTQAVTFGPVLVKDGEGVINGDGGWGYAPRSAIGQREDGTVIMIVTDGRLIHGADNLGASMKDLMNLMLKYGAVNAANLDGGSSTTMVKDGVLLNQPSDVLGERKVATSFVVMPE